MRRLAVILVAVAALLGLNACHGYEIYNSQWFALTEDYCGGGSAMIRVGQPSWNGRAQGFTYRHWTNNNCEQSADAPANTMRLETDFYQLAEEGGLCEPGPGVYWNQENQASVGVAWYPPSCGSGHYYTHADHAINLPGLGWESAGTNSPVDPYCDQAPNPCG